MPVTGLTLALAAWGFRLGWIAAHLTETDAINHYAERYLENRQRDGTGAGASASDCIAYPGDGWAEWLVIVCGPNPRDPAKEYTFRVNRLGGFEYGEDIPSGSGKAKALAPET